MRFSHFEVYCVQSAQFLGKGSKNVALIFCISNFLKKHTPTDDTEKHFRLNITISPG